jgi:RHS repeat-associated protein
VRATFYKNPSTGQLEVIQRDDYYAFGLRKVTTGGTNKYLYNGKELQEELGEYDYGTRFYDPVIGRWDVLDPFSDDAPDITSYRYCFNNPINYTDPDGLYEVDANGNIKITDKSEINSIVSYLQNNGKNSDYDQILGYIINSNNFGFDLPGVTVNGRSQNAYQQAGNEIYASQIDALRRARLDGSRFYGVDVHTSKYLKNGEGFTLPGYGITVNKDHLTDVDLLKHEYGHILQARKWGMATFYSKVVPASLRSAQRHRNEKDFYHEDTWTEWSANDLSKDFFSSEKWNSKQFPTMPKRYRYGNWPGQAMSVKKFFQGR